MHERQPAFEAGACTYIPHAMPIDAGLLEKIREAMSLAPDTPDAEIVERALRIELGRKALHEAQARSDLTEEQALELAYSELHATRTARRAA